jgi:heme/copper-type cytochrome/quinol oxidase subunit 3
MTTAAEAVAVERRRVAQPSGWWGMAIFCASEAMLFGLLIATYTYLRFRAERWPPPGIAPPKVAVPLLLTALLVASSLPIALAARAARDGRVGAARGALAAALAIQAAYFGLQMHLFLHDLARFTPQQGAYGSAYFTLLGAHHTHVAVGLLLDVWLLLRLFGGLTTYRVNGLRATAFYWHFVNALAVLVVLTQISPSL